MSGTAPTGGSAPRTTLDELSTPLTRRMVMNEVACVALVALSMFVIWRGGPGSAWGTLVVLLVGTIVIGRVWAMPGVDLKKVPQDSATDPNAAAKQMQRLADRTLKNLLVPSIVGFAATLLSWGWQPVFFGALISVGGYTFLGPSRTRLSQWRDRMEELGGKTGL